ncbi:MAG: hypothetical protein KAU95_02155 [Candidatus Aenigmarchaeota archaeon]|nr:hypothetical protein [Candidatus Aenigmarchaeota archaeon]
MKGKVKKEFNILLPKLFGERVVSKTMADKPDKIMGRKFSVYARDVSPETQKYYYKFSFKVTKIEDDKAMCSFVGHEVSRSFISRCVKTDSTRIDGYVICKTKDDVELILKPFIVTPRKVKSSVATDIRIKLEDSLKTHVSKNNLDAIVKGILSDDLQRKLKKTISLVYPINLIEIRKTEIKIKVD